LRFSESTNITRANRGYKYRCKSETPTFSLSFGTKEGDVAVDCDPKEEIHVGNVLTAFSSLSSTTNPKIWKHNEVMCSREAATLSF
jgi:hypothetical protein